MTNSGCEVVVSGMNLSIRHWLAENNSIELARLNLSEAGMAGIALRFAQEMERQSGSIFEVCVLAEVLELPLVVAWSTMGLLAQLTSSLLRVLSQKKPLKRNEGTWLAFQIAYLHAIERLLAQEAALKRPWIDRAMLPAETSSPDFLLDRPQLTELLKTLRPANLSDTQAEQALSQWSDSFLVQQINSTVSAWLIANSAEETESRLLVQRLSHGLPGHLLACIALHPLSLPQLQKFVRLGNVGAWSASLTENDDYEILEATPAPPPPTLLPIDLTRERYRANLSIALSEPLFEEYFALKDIYLPLKGLVSGSELTHTLSNPDTPVDLMEWAQAQLTDLSSIAVIEAPPGYGKSSFCQMWAAKVAAQEYPDWMPVLIQLRDVTLGSTLEQTLDSALPLANFTCADGWLSPVHSPCLLILDGLDELPRSPLAEDQIWLLIDQIVRFQSQYTGPTGLPRHKVILTCRTHTLSSAGIETLHLSSTHSQTPLLSHLRRIAIAPMGQEEVKVWFKNWSRLQTKNLAHTYFNFLKQGGMFRTAPPAKELAALMRQPLMLYWVGVLHRDGLLDETLFQMPYPQVKFEIYDRLMTWVLGEPTAGLSRSRSLEAPVREGLAHAGRTREAIANLLDGRSPEQVRRQMQRVALSVLQTGRSQINQAILQQRLETEINLPAFSFRVQKADSTQWVEFSHPNLGEYLCAEQIATELKAIAQVVRDPYGEMVFAVTSPQAIAQQLYNLLGYGILPLEMEELIAERLWREEARDPNSFQFRMLFGRLHRFYRSYCRGRWMDEGLAHQTRTQLQPLNNPLNALQVDAAVGLNVFLLLCACRREAQIPFWPCGYTKERSKSKARLSVEAVSAEDPLNFNPSQLLALAGRAAVLAPNAFWQRVRHSLKSIHLSGVYLHRAMLAGGNLQESDLSAAVLEEANLTAANLRDANLSWANLTDANLAGANLAGANLEGANLTGANLQGCNLQSANLTNACLFNTQMDEDAWQLARQKGAFFSIDRYLAYNQAIAAQSIKAQPSTDGAEEDETSVFPVEIAESSGVIAADSLADEVASAETVAYRPPSSSQPDDDAVNAETMVYRPDLENLTQELPLYPPE